MPTVKKRHGRTVPSGSTGYHLRLFIAGNEQNSTIAREALERICATHLNNYCRLEIVDVLKDFRPALEEGILVTPALVVFEPGPRTVVFGNLTDTKRVLAALKVMV